MRANSSFEYLRVQQVSDPGGDLLAQIGCSAARHMIYLDKQLAHHQVRPDVLFRLIQQDHISGQLVVDGETLVFFISGVDRHGKKRLVAISVMRDPGSSMIREYCERLRANLFDSAVHLDLAKLEESLQKESPDAA